MVGIFAFYGVFLALFYISGTTQRANAATSNGSASATVVQPASIGLISNLTVVPVAAPVAPPASTTEDTTDDSTDTDESASQAAATTETSRLTGAPAVISISGEPNQTFSIALPETGVLLPQADGVEVFNFSHDAGLTPSISANGEGQFSIQAQVGLAAVIGGAEGGGDAAGGDFSTASAEDGGDSGDGAQTGQDGEAPAGQGDQAGNDSEAQAEDDAATEEDSVDGGEADPLEFALAVEPPHFDVVVSYN